MFRRISSAVASLTLAAAFSLTATSPAQAAALSISGKVTDASTKSAISGVCITVGVPGQFCWTTTSATGDFFIDLAAQSAQPGQQWELFFIKGGYTTTSQKITVNGAETMDAQLVPNGQPISTAPPPSCNNGFVPGCSLNPPPTTPPGPTFTVYLPNITRTLGGPSGWHTPFIVQNIGTTSTSLTLDFFRFSDGAKVASHGGVVQPGRSFVDSPRDEADLPDNTQFSVVITSAGAPVVAVVNEHQGPGAGNEALSYSGVSSGATTVYLPLVSDMASGWLTTMIMQNVGTTATTITASFVSLNGSKTATITKMADAGRSAFIDPRVEAALVAGTEYSATVTATQPIAVVANNHNDLPGTVAPRGDSYNGVVVSTPSTAYLPYITKNTDGVGRTSRVIVQNAGSTSITPTLTLYPFSGVGGVPVPQTSQSVAPGGSFAFTPQAPDGEYSLTISGGTFAAVATATTGSTAMYYTSTTQTAGKIFLPNVTRKLTQNPAADPGWNTPILVQSATATAATLKWFRFSDGSLVTTQTLTLSPNVTLRVDPATVTGLSDNSQYAVVLESPDTVVAIVTELNLVGGDDAMIYKGFPVLTP